MNLRQIEFKPKKTTERSAIALRGKVWYVVDWKIPGKRLIRSLDGKDLRWINENQITKEL